MKRSEKTFPFALAVLVAVGCGSGKPQDASAKPPADAPMQLTQATSEAAPQASTGSAAITGRVHLSGSAPAMSKIDMAADPVCQQQHATPVMSEEVVVDPSGMLQNVFVYIKEGVQGTTPAPTTPVVLEQSGCQYHPHVFGLQVDQPFEIVNSDGTLHNINAKPTINQPFNIAQPVKGMKTTKKFSKPEVMVKFKCNVHPWMNAYGGVLPHPFFSVSAADGTFAIKGLPAGTYTVEAWHEKYGTQTQRVTVADGESQSVDFTFKAQ